MTDTPEIARIRAALAAGPTPGAWVQCPHVRFNDSNNGFWDRTADERAERMRAAAERGGAENFFDLPPEERARAYED